MTKLEIKFLHDLPRRWLSVGLTTGSATPDDQLAEMRRLKIMSTVGLVTIMTSLRHFQTTTNHA